MQHWKQIQHKRKFIYKNLCIIFVYGTMGFTLFPNPTRLTLSSNQSWTNSFLSDHVLFCNWPDSNFSGGLFWNSSNSTREKMEGNGKRRRHNRPCVTSQSTKISTTRNKPRDRERRQTEEREKRHTKKNKNRKYKKQQETHTDNRPFIGECAKQSINIVADSGINML